MPRHIPTPADFAAAAPRARTMHAALQTWLSTTYGEEPQLAILAALSFEIARLVAVAPGVTPAEQAATLSVIRAELASEVSRVAATRSSPNTP